MNYQLSLNQHRFTFFQLKETANEQRNRDRTTQPRTIVRGCVVRRRSWLCCSFAVGVFVRGCVACSRLLDNGNDNKQRNRERAEEEQRNHEQTTQARTNNATANEQRIGRNCELSFVVTTFVRGCVVRDF